MADREKVINGLEHCVMGVHGCMVGCPYMNEDKCQINLKRDALALLKEQEAVKPFSDDDGAYWCGSCHEDIVWHQKFCSSCGRPVLWKGR